MKLERFAAAVFFACALLLHGGTCIGNQTKALDRLHGPFDRRVRATNCIENSTHCHCAIHAAGENATCYKPVADRDGRCLTGGCAGGYKCDCDSNELCAKLSTLSYTATGAPEGPTGELDCVGVQRVVPRLVVGHTSDFHIAAYDEYELMINGRAVAGGRPGEYRVTTVELGVGDVVGLKARRLSTEVYGVKLRFNDVQDEVRTIDENWYSSSTWEPRWMEGSFDPGRAGWVHPTVVSSMGQAGFDPDISWMWHGDAEVSYFRYVIPRR